jgi:hypothetical protein
MTNYFHESADAVKVGVATSPATLSLFGYPMADWGYVLSAIVSVMFIIEKTPVVIMRFKQFKRWLKREPKE